MVPDVIAIDGPSGAGKSTVARELAKRTGYRYLNTGAMYRAVTLYLLRTSRLESVKTGAMTIADSLAGFELTMEENEILLNGENVTRETRAHDVTQEVSFVSSLPEVRKAMVEQQRKMAEVGKFVLEGRDIGTNVFPDTPYKFFITAAPAERARRRWLEEGGTGDLTEILGEIVARDRKDSTRELNPLRKADDAYEIDTTGLTVAEVVDKIIEYVDSINGEHHESR